jgi:hypothetical protein
MEDPFGSYYAREMGQGMKDEALSSCKGRFFSLKKETGQSEMSDESV